MNIMKSHYAFPSQHISVTGNDVIYTNLYFGGLVYVTDTVTYDVPVDPLEFDWNQYEKIRTHQLRFIHRYDHLIARILTLFFYIGLCLLLFQAYTQPGALTSILLVLYLVLLVLRFVRGKPVLYGRVQKNGQPLQFGIVHIFRDTEEVLTKVVDAYGRYVAIVVPGTYTVRIDERTGVDTYNTIYTHQLHTRDGIINLDVML